MFIEPITRDFLIKFAHSMPQPTGDVLDYAETLAARGRYDAATEDEIEQFDALLEADIFDEEVY